MSSTGQKLTANRVPGERIAEMSPARTTNSGNITTTEAVIDSVTAALVAGRKYRVVWTPGVLSSTAADTAFVRLREDSLTGTQMNILRVSLPATGGAGSRFPATIEAPYVAAATGSKTFVGTLVRASGAGNITVQAASTYPVELYVEYISG